VEKRGLMPQVIFSKVFSGIKSTLFPLFCSDRVYELILLFSVSFTHCHQSEVCNWCTEAGHIAG